MTGMSTLKPCDKGHEIYFPSRLEDLALREGHEIAFYSSCECGTVYLVVIWPGDTTRVMAKGGTEIADLLEESDWPERRSIDANGPFFYRVAPEPGAATFLLKRLDEARQN